MRTCAFRVYVVLSLAAGGGLLAPRAASAQYRPAAAGDNGGIAENYHIEAAYGWWNATPELIVNSESLGILGSDVDLISDLGIEKHRLGKFNLVLKPAMKHRLKYEHLPIKYETDAIPVHREFVFNGQRYSIGLPVTTSVNFSTNSLGYEYDFLHFPMFYVGASINVKLTTLDVDLQSPVGAEFFKQTAPIPAIGFAGRGYLTKNMSVDSEIQFFRIPQSLQEQIQGDGSYNDFDIHTTYNINKYVGTQLGWRKTTLFYQTNDLANTGDLKFTGIYFGGVIRY
jgi:hypothetical protein